MYAYEGNDLRIVIPKNLRRQMIRNLHAANQGATSTLRRARQVMYWPGMDRDVNIHSETCSDCREYAPSNTKEPLIPSIVPEYPFQHVAADLFEINGHNYLVYVDRLTGFAELAHYSSSPSIISILSEFFHRWDVAEELSLDGGPNINSYETKMWLQSWGTNIRTSAAYYPQSNGRAEAGVKSLKRLLRCNTGHNGSINTDSVATALLQYSNTPLRGISQSPAELALGRQLRDTLPLPRDRYKVSEHWAYHLRNREKIMSETNRATKLKYDEHSKEQPPLKVRDKVRCQNIQSNKWDRTGKIVEVNNLQYTVKMDGSGRTSNRNRCHLLKIVERLPEVVQTVSGYIPSSASQPPSVLPAPPTTNLSLAREVSDDVNQPPLCSKRHRNKPKRYYNEFELGVK